MSTQNQEVKTTFTWDTSSADAGAKRMEKAMERLTDAEKKALRDNKGHGAGGGNFSAGMRDLAEGRGVNAMQRLGHLISATAGRVALYMVAMRAAGEATRYLREEMEKTDEASRRLETNFSAQARVATTSSSAQKPGTITESIRAMDESSLKENDHQVGLSRASDMLSAMKDGNNPFSYAAAKGIEAYNAFNGRRTPEEEADASKQRSEYFGKEAGRLRSMRSASYSHETEIAQMQGPGGNPFEAKRRELDIQQKLEESESRTAGLSKTDLENIRTRYDVLRRTVSAEESLVLTRQAYQSEITRIQGSPQSSFGKGLSSASARIGQSNRLLGSGLLNQQQEGEEALKIQQQEVNRRQQIEGRYLNPDGSRRRAGAINRDFRSDRREQRLRARFQRQYDSGAIDKDTGRRRVTGDAPGGGLRAGGLTSGSIQGASMATASWKDAFGPKAPDKPAGGGGSAAKTTGDLYSLLDQRLPNQTA